MSRNMADRLWNILYNTTSWNEGFKRDTSLWIKWRNVQTRTRARTLIHVGNFHSNEVFEKLQRIYFDRPKREYLQTPLSLSFTHTHAQTDTLCLSLHIYLFTETIMDSIFRLNARETFSVPILSYCPRGRRAICGPHERWTEAGRDL
jgi:hypothetical protein